MFRSGRAASAAAGASHPRRATGRRTVWAACSALLDYPTPELVAGLDELSAAVGRLPATYADAAAAARRRTCGPRTCGRCRRSTSPPSTTPGAARSTSPTSPTATPAGAGWRWCSSSRPTAGRASSSTPATRVGSCPTTCARCSSSAPTVDADGAWRLLLDHRAGVEMLRLALAEAESPWHDAVLALCDTLPALRGDEADGGAPAHRAGPPGRGGRPAAVPDRPADPRGPPTAPAMTTSSG